MNREGRQSGGNRWENVSAWDRINAKIELGDVWTDGTACWNWTGAHNRNGYGIVWLNGRRIQAYRATWELTHEQELPDGYEIDHLCRNPRCVNPMHLEAVTRRENIRRSDNFAGRFARQTHCKRGHEFTPENTRISKRGERICRSCCAARERARRRGTDLDSYIHVSQFDLGARLREVVGDLT